MTSASVGRSNVPMYCGFIFVHVFSYRPETWTSVFGQLTKCRVIWEELHAPGCYHTHCCY